MSREPHDAPSGPIARWFARRARHALIGDQEHTGGMLGCEIPSPRLEGWIQKAGFDSYVLSRYVDGATQWAVAEPGDLRGEANRRTKQQKETYRRCLLPLLSAIIAEGRPSGRELKRHFVLRHTYELLELVDDDELESERIALEILEAKILPCPLPPFGTFEGWFRGWSLGDMAGVPDPDSGN